MARKLDPNKKTSILKAARLLFKRNGFHETSMIEIANHAGVSNGTVYHYFGSKANLVDALCEDFISRMTDAIQPVFNNVNTSDVLASAIHTAFEFSTREKDLLVLFNLRTSLGRPQGMLNAEIRLRAFIENWMLNHMDKGELNAYDTKVASEMITGIVDYFARVALIWSNLGTEHFEKTVTLMIERAFIKNYDK